METGRREAQKLIMTVGNNRDIIGFACFREKNQTKTQAASDTIPY